MSQEVNVVRCAQPGPHGAHYWQTESGDNFDCLGSAKTSSDVCKHWTASVQIEGQWYSYCRQCNKRSAAVDRVDAKRKEISHHAKKCWGNA